MCSLPLMSLETCTMFMQPPVISNCIKQGPQYFVEKILHKFKEEGNQVYALDYNRDGSKFATGGKDCQVLGIMTFLGINFYRLGESI